MLKGGVNNLKIRVSILRGGVNDLIGKVLMGTYG